MRLNKKMIIFVVLIVLCLSSICIASTLPMNKETSKVSVRTNIPTCKYCKRPMTLADTVEHKPELVGQCKCPEHTDCTIYQYEQPITKWYICSEYGCHNLGYYVNIKTLRVYNVHTRNH
ncbi:hypothetical protein PV797_03750 [Clostridiaceae bacterium M8S5]|nr:hypothetical protein PV797_03750 [Clostridiaceae bacterium M8S5]